MRKPLVAVIIGLALGGIAFGGYLTWRGKQSTPSQEQLAPLLNLDTLLTWRDPNGFTFQYPDGLTIDSHEEDQENYAHIEFRHPDYPGSVFVWAKDTTAKDVSAWAKTEKRFQNANILDTTFANTPGKKVLIDSPKQIVVGTISDEIIWTVEAELGDSDYWTKVYETIADSFRFIPIGSSDDDQAITQGDSQSESLNTGTAIVQEYYDEEEVLE